MKYKPTIGLEIHAELSTKSKLFCGSDNFSPPGTEPNINTCEVCSGHPGVLPVMNEEAVNSAIRVGLALGSKIRELTKWDRKQYFYPDLPKGYQISQYDLPLCYGGGLKLSSGKTVHITRVHLEEDTGKLTHAGKSHSLVDLNRAGTPLLELVTEPDITGAAEAKEFAREYQAILRFLGIANADMEKGEMRVEANISVSGGKKLGTKVEIKNLNSFKALERAIEFEISRQSEVLDSGESVVQETRGWSDPKQKTYSQRLKETAADYRYFPEPDLPELEIQAALIKDLKEKLPELPAAKRAKFEKMGVKAEYSQIICSNLAMCRFFESVVADGAEAKMAATHIVNEVMGRVKESDIGKVDAQEYAHLLEAIKSKELTGPLAKTVLDHLITKGGKVSEIITSQGFSQMAEAGLSDAVKNVISANPKPVAEYKAGKEEALKFLIGKVMVSTKGLADPNAAADELKRHLLDQPEP